MPQAHPTVAVPALLYPADEQGYVRLVRTGGQRRGPGPTPFTLQDDGNWAVAEDDTEVDDGVLTEAAEAGADRRALFADADLAPVDPATQSSIDDAARPRRSKGQTPHSRMNLRRLITALPWKLLGPRPALVSLTYPGTWQPWVPDGRV